jgi:hypothetical protein
MGTIIGPMTLWASKTDDKIVIHGNIHLDVDVKNGSVSSFAVTEDIGHVRAFWGSLGKLLEEES